MNSPLRTELTPVFSDSPGKINLTIANDVGAYADADVHLLLLPAVGATIACSAGSIRSGGPDKIIDLPAGVVQFSGSDTSSLPSAPAADPPGLNVLFAFDAHGNPISVGVTILPDGTLKASSPFTGICAFTAYKTTARRLTYTPQPQRLGEGDSVIFGVVCAYFEGSMAVHQTAPFGVTGGAQFEIYRIVSNAVTTVDGEFEKPPSYPSSGIYPDKPLKIDVQVSLMTERVHEIGYMDENGFGWIQSFYVPILNPYSPTADPGYKPVKRLVPSPLGDRFSKDLQLAALNAIKKRGLAKL